MSSKVEKFINAVKSGSHTVMVAAYNALYCFTVPDWSFCPDEATRATRVTTTNGTYKWVFDDVDGLSGSQCRQEVLVFKPALPLFKNFDTVHSMPLTTSLVRVPTKVINFHYEAVDDFQITLLKGCISIPKKEVNRQIRYAIHGDVINLYSLILSMIMEVEGIPDDIPNNIRLNSLTSTEGWKYL